MSDEKRALRRMVRKAALNAGVPLRTWLETNGIPRTVYYSDHCPTLECVYRFCMALGMKPSEFFASMGK